MREPYLQDPDVTLYHGDVLEVLRELPDESVHCIATSPPFYALRDYGTGRWDGGDEGCDHRAPPTGGPNPERYTPGGGEMFRAANDKSYRDTCGKCGARRIDQQIGLEETPDAWAAALVAVFREARRVLRKDGTLWVECGDSYAQTQTRDRRDTGPDEWGSRGGERYATGTVAAGLKPKDLLGQPWLLAFALRADGWWLRGCNIWAKPNAMPESAKDRCTTAHSYVFQLSKSARCFFDGDAISEPAAWDYWGSQSKVKINDDMAKAANWHMETNGRDAFQASQSKHPRSVWNIPTQGYPEAHFATWPEALARRIILAACPESVCGECGKARERLTARKDADNLNAPDELRRLYDRKSDFHTRTKGLGGQAHQDWLDAHPKETIGYTDCGHNAYQPGVILDPFVGSGTTCFVGRKLGRRSIGIDLNSEYLDLAAKRLQQQSLFA